MTTSKTTQTRERMRAFGLELAVHRYRPDPAAAAGLTVLVLHGYLDSGATWGAVARPLADAGFDVVVPDLRGYGESDRVPSGNYYHFPDYVADVEALVDALAPARLAVVGHSMGGTIAALWAGARPARLERLALLEGMGPPAAAPEESVARMRAFLRGVLTPPPSRPLQSMEDAVARLAANHARVPREALEAVARALTRPREDGLFEWRHDPMHRATSPTPFSASAFRAYLAEIACPTLVVSGGVAGWHAPDEATRIAALRDASHFEIPDAGHMMHWSRPAELAAGLAAFLAPR